MLPVDNLLAQLEQCNIILICSWIVILIDNLASNSELFMWISLSLTLEIVIAQSNSQICGRCSGGLVVEVELI